MEDQINEIYEWFHQLSINTNFSFIINTFLCSLLKTEHLTGRSVSSLYAVDLLSPKNQSCDCSLQQLRLHVGLQVTFTNDNGGIF